MYGTDFLAGTRWNSGSHKTRSRLSLGVYSHNILLYPRVWRDLPWRSLGVVILFVFGFDASARRALKKYPIRQSDRGYWLLQRITTHGMKFSTRKRILLRLDERSY